MNILIYTLIFFSISLCKRALIYKVDPTELEALMETYPSAVFFYLENDTESIEMRKQFIVAARDLAQYGVILGSFDCTHSPDLCKKAEVKNAPEIIFFQFDLLLLFLKYKKFHLFI